MLHQKTHVQQKRPTCLNYSSNSPFQGGVTDYSKFLLVLNFPFVSQYTHILAFFFYTDAIEINWETVK